MARKSTTLILMMLLQLGYAFSAQQGATAPVIAPIILGQNILPEANVLETQLKINKDALLQGNTDAASVFAYSKEPLYRKVLLEVLSSSENKSARIAVCKALNQSRSSEQQIPDKVEFVEPLIGILLNGDAETAKFAAQATLVFSYDLFEAMFEKLLIDEKIPLGSKINIIAALQEIPEKRAVIRLIELMESPVPEISSAAKAALQNLGMPVEDDSRSISDLIAELNQKGREEFLRNWKIRQLWQKQVSELKKQRDWWRQKYVEELEKRYTATTDLTQRGQFLAELLNSQESVLKRWAVDKVKKWRLETKLPIPSQTSESLMVLLSDPDRDIRLATAEVLSLLVELNTSEKLLVQYKVEKDEDVKTAQFVALTGACAYAFLPDTPYKLAPEIREQTLEIAVEFLTDENPARAKRGAEALGKLLEQDGLAAEKANGYLGMIVERYKNAGESLRVELLGSMAGLCAQSVYKVKCGELYWPVFENVLIASEDPRAREVAVEGLSYINPVKALQVLRIQAVNDVSNGVQTRILNLAGEHGTPEDLEWLAGKLIEPAASEPTWQTILKVFKRCDAGVFVGWQNRVETIRSHGKIDAGQYAAFLEMTELKAVGEGNASLLKNVREKLADLYRQTGAYDKSAEKYGQLRDAGQTPELKAAYLRGLMEVYLLSGKFDQAVSLLNNGLLASDLGSNDVLVQAIDAYFSNPPAGADIQLLLNAIIPVNHDNRQQWLAQVKVWKSRFQVPAPQQTTTSPSPAPEIIGQPAVASPNQPAQ